MSSSALPPPGNLPSWSRVSALDRSRYPKPFIRDRIPVPPGGGANIGNVDVKFLETMSNPKQAICYDKNVKFLQQQHAETLTKLHEELDALKRENKELQFKVILSHQGDAPPGNASNNQNQNGSSTHSNDVKVLVLEEQLKDLRLALEESSAKNSAMQQKICDLQSKAESKTNAEKHIGDNYAISSKIHRRKFTISSTSAPLPLNATLHPLRVRIGSEEAPRIPTFEECEIIIQRLHEANCKQVADLSKIRSNPASSFSQNTPDTLAMKTYGPAKNESFSDTRLPRIPVRPLKKKSVKSANNVEAQVSLPALKNTISSTISDRQKRQNAMQKHKTVKSYKW